MNMFTLVFQSLVGLGFMAQAMGNFIGFKTVFARLPLHKASRWAVGALGLLGGLALLAAIAQPFLVFFVATYLVLLSAGMLLLQTLRKHTQGRSAAIVLMACAAVMAILQPLGLKVLALPRAENLPLDRVSEARIVKTYGEGEWFESVKVGPDSTVYLAVNKGEDYATGDKSQAHGKIIARKPDGSEKVFFELPLGTTAGVIGFDNAGQMFVTSQGGKLGVWRVSEDGEGKLITSLPQGAWPNGICAGPDGQLYVADASLGVIWRIDPRSGNASQAIASDALRARRFIALAPGANGLHFFGESLYVTVSDAGRILKYPLGKNGQFGDPVVFAEGIPGDDFAIDGQGTLYVTTHPFNTIVRVTQDGRRSVIADAQQGIVGATDVAFGTLPGDRDTLYVATDGGAFSGDKNARGVLLALKIPGATVKNSFSTEPQSKP